MELEPVISQGGMAGLGIIRALHTSQVVGWGCGGGAGSEVGGGELSSTQNG